MLDMSKICMFLSASEYNFWLVVWCNFFLVLGYINNTTHVYQYNDNPSIKGIICSEVQAVEPLSHTPVHKGVNCLTVPRPLSIIIIIIISMQMDG